MKLTYGWQQESIDYMNETAPREYFRQIARECSAKESITEAGIVWRERRSAAGLT